MFFSREALLCSLLGFYVHKTYGMGSHANDCDDIIMQVDPIHLQFAFTPPPKVDWLNSLSVCISSMCIPWGRDQFVSMCIIFIV